MLEFESEFLSLMDARREATVWIGGSAGDGIASAGDIWLRTASRLGLGAFAHNSYQSVIRGGHVLLQTRVGPFPVLSQGGPWDALVALDQNTLDLHLKTARPGAIALINSDKVKAPEGAAVCALPVGELTKDILPKNPVMQNTALLGALVCLLRLNWDVFEGASAPRFGKQKADVAEQNVVIARRSWEYAQKTFKPAEHLALSGDGHKRMILSGNQAIALGAVAGGCKFYSAYPMTPASSILHWLAPRAAAPRHADEADGGRDRRHQHGHRRRLRGRARDGRHVGRRLCAHDRGYRDGGMIETPVVVVLVPARTDPRRALPPKRSRAICFRRSALRRANSRGDPGALDLVDAYYTTVEALIWPRNTRCR